MYSAYELKSVGIFCAREDLKIAVDFFVSDQDSVLSRYGSTISDLDVSSVTNMSCSYDGASSLKIPAWYGLGLVN